MFPITGCSHYEANRENFDFASVTFSVILKLERGQYLLTTLKLERGQYLSILTE